MSKTHTYLIPTSLQIPSTKLECMGIYYVQNFSISKFSIPALLLNTTSALNPNFPIVSAISSTNETVQVSEITAGFQKIVFTMSLCLLKSKQTLISLSFEVIQL